MAFTLGTPVTATAVGGGLPNAITLTIPDCTAGNALFVGICWTHASANISSVTCSDESNLTVISTKPGGGGINAFCQGALLPQLTSGGTKTVTVTFTADIETDGSAVGFEISGGYAANLLDASANFHAGNTANPTVNVTATASSDLLIGLLISSNADTVGTDFTGIALPAINTLSGLLEYRINAGVAGSKTVNFVSGGTPANDDWSIYAFAFRLDTAAPTGTLTLTGNAPLVSISTGGSGSLEAIRAMGDNLLVSGSLNVGYGILQALKGTGQATAGAGMFGYGTLKRITGVGYTAITNVATLQPIRATGMWGNIITGYGVLQPLVVPYRTGRAALERIRAAGTAAAGLSSTFVTKVMNARTTAMSEYQNHAFNSYAYHKGRYLAAGAGGLYAIGGTMDGTANIDWVWRTGQLDDKNRMLKKLPEVLFSLRADKAIRVRVYCDDSTYYDYTLPATKTDTIRQQRVKTGKGMRGRYFMVEVQGLQGGYAEFDAIDIAMIPTTRRIG